MSDSWSNFFFFCSQPFIALALFLVLPVSLSCPRVCDYVQLLTCARFKAVALLRITVVSSFLFFPPLLFFLLPSQVCTTDVSFPLSLDLSSVLRLSLLSLGLSVFTLCLRTTFTSLNFSLSYIRRTRLLFPPLFSLAHGGESWRHRFATQTFNSTFRSHSFSSRSRSVSLSTRSH